MSLRRAAVAGTWYPGAADPLGAAIDRLLGDAAAGASGDVMALVAPHAGLQYSGRVAAHAYRAIDGPTIDRVILVGPSHFVGFDGVALVASGGFETPLGVSRIDDRVGRRLLEIAPIVRERPAPHAKEHSLEMQLPFVQRIAPQAAIVPLLIGFQTASTAAALARALASILAEHPRTLLVASSDLSHYHDRMTAARLDGVVVDCVERFDADALQHALDRTPEHACGGGAIVAVMRAVRQHGGPHAAVLQYADSGDVSGDSTSVVGYLAAAFGRFT